MSIGHGFDCDSDSDSGPNGKSASCQLAVAGCHWLTTCTRSSCLWPALDTRYHRHAVAQTILATFELVIYFFFFVVSLSHSCLPSRFNCFVSNLWICMLIADQVLWKSACLSNLFDFQFGFYCWNGKPFQRFAVQLSSRFEFDWFWLKSDFL